MGAFDAFLKIEGIEGESQDRTHKGEIEIDSYGWGVEQTGVVGGGGGVAGRAVAQDFHFTMKLSKASPNLMLACATGRHFQQATLTCRKAGGANQVEFLKVKLEDLLVSSYAPGGADAGEDRPTESISLNFSKIDFLYTVEKTGETVETVFDFFQKAD
jgi:type VI secretion system secreted protein Hcp